MQAAGPGPYQAPSDAEGLVVVHISDTHGKHWDLLPLIPPGDILIHSGDVDDIRDEEEYRRKLADFNEFLGALPHRHKVYVSGNHEAYTATQPWDTTQRIMSNATYLQDWSVTIEGVTIYGSPWTNCGHGFSADAAGMGRVWANIPSQGPEGVDILVTHMPPFNVLDLAWECDKRRYTRGTCGVCGRGHLEYSHWGDPGLYDEVVGRIRPRYHLFGHVHDDTGFRQERGVVFCNASMDLSRMPVVFTIAPRAAAQQQQQQPQLQLPPRGAPAAAPPAAPAPAPSDQAWQMRGGFVVHLQTGFVLDVDLVSDPSGSIVLVWQQLAGERLNQLWLFEGNCLSSLCGPTRVLHAGDTGVCMGVRGHTVTANEKWSFLADGSLVNDAGYQLVVLSGRLRSIRHAG